MTKIAVSQRQEVVDLCVSGWTRGEVAAEYGVTTDCIKVIIKNKGVRLMGAKRGRAISNDSRNLAIAEMYRSGKTQCAVAAAFGMSSAGVHHVLKSLNVAPHAPGTVSSRPDGKWKRAIAPTQYPEVIEKYKSGMSLEEVGTHYGVTRERIRQIVEAHGVSKMDGGATMRMLRNVGAKVDAIRAKNERREIWCRDRWDLSLEEYSAHVAEYGSCSLTSSPMHKYMHHRKNARFRGLGWNFTFASWWRAWQESGKWEQRGRGKTGYVMARWGDGDAPYGPDTVYICTQPENARDGYIVSPAADRVAKARITRMQKSTGATT